MASKVKFEIEATARERLGKSASRRLRHEEKVPGVVYGGGKEPIALIIDHNKIAKALSQEAFYSHILTLKTNGDSEKVILKDVQRHPYKPKIAHVDFQRVRADVKLHMNIPLHFMGGEKCPGVKGGGLLSHIETDVEVTCLPDHLPEYLEVDISNLDLNDILHLSDIKLPQGVELVALSHNDNKPIVAVHVPRVEEEVTAAPEVPAEVPATAQKSEAEKGSEEGKGKG